MLVAGKKFFQKKKQPIPVDLTAKDWAGQVRKATEATYMYHTGGTSLSIRHASPTHARIPYSSQDCRDKSEVCSGPTVYCRDGPTPNETSTPAEVQGCGCTFSAVYSVSRKFASGVFMALPGSNKARFLIGPGCAGQPGALSQQSSVRRMWRPSSRERCSTSRASGTTCRRCSCALLSQPPSPSTR